LEAKRFRKNWAIAAVVVGRTFAAGRGWSLSVRIADSDFDQPRGAARLLLIAALRWFEDEQIADLPGLLRRKLSPA
jgi:hypothetical protein